MNNHSAKDINDLSETKRSDLELEQKENLSGKGQVPVQSDIQSAPLSFAQQRLWFLDQLEPNSIAYNLRRKVRLTGTIQVDALQKALDAIVVRHKALRTTIRSIDGSPSQIIGEPRPVDLKIINLASLSAQGREIQLKDAIKDEIQRRFNLSKDLMLRGTLIYISEREHILILSMHHIASDGWSTGILMRELATLYESFSTGNTLSLPPLQIQYADFAVWQRQWLQGENLSKQLSYWKERLSDAPAALDLPIDRPRPSVRTYHGRKQATILPASLYEAIRRLGQQQGSTLFMTLLAAFNVLLYRYTRQEDILIGTPIAGRTRVEIEPLIGFFVNTLVLRTDLSGNPTFRDLLRRVRKIALEAYTHQDLPFEKLVEELQPERSLSHSPLFQVMFVLQNTPRSAWELPGLTITPFDTDTDTPAKFDLVLAASEKGKELHVRFKYNSDLFDDTTITRMQNHFQSLLEGIVADPDQRLSDLPLLTTAEKNQLMTKSKATPAEHHQEKCIHQLFEAQVERTPDATAVIFDEQRLTFRELNQRSNQLAHYLQKHGIGPEKMVGLCVERSLQMVIGLLGILKAGGAYVPLDPKYPQERLERILANTEAKVLVAQTQTLQRIPVGNRRAIDLDGDWNKISLESGENLENLTSPENLAYVIFTSGSTGSPKGVMIQHSSLVSFTATALDVYEMKSSDRVLQFASISWDTSVEEIFPTLCCGATLVLRTSDMVTSNSAFVEKCREWSITIINLPAAFWHGFSVSDLESLALVRSMRIILIGGEKAHGDQLLRWQKCEGRQPIRFINGYGATEATAVTTICELSTFPVTDTALREVPIGRPLPNAETYILDQDLQLVPIAIAGELHIGGFGLARGYLDQPDLTSQKFVPNPFNDKPGSRLYRTGDLARYLPDGNIEVLGRIDHQVKIRGFRIEPEEVELVINQFPGVRESLVVALENTESEKRLVAYVIVEDSQELKLNKLRDHLQQTLPEYMLPSAYVTMENFPLTPSGKIDRSKLPAPEEATATDARDYVEPRNELEFQVTKIWEKTLGVKPIGIRDNFFQLGGHSLLGVKLFSQLEKLTGKRLALATLFQAQTIEKLTEILQDAGWKPTLSSLVPIQRKGSKPPLYCVHPADGNVVEYSSLSQYLGTDQPFYGLQAQGLEGNGGTINRVEDMAVHYIQEIRDFQPQGPYYLAGHCFGGIIALEMARRLQAEGEEVAFLGLLDTWAPGYPKVLPLPTRVYNKINYHVQHLRSIEPKEKLKYLLYKAHKVFRRKIRPLTLPKPIREVRMAGREAIVAGRQALRNINVPQDYAGKVTLFRATDRTFRVCPEPTLGWRDFLTGELEVIDIPGDHAIVLKPAVEILAQKMAACLDEVRKK
jgi:amino acid adenylation domain-containing protein